jgi:hypothetical protein
LDEANDFINRSIPGGDAGTDQRSVCSPRVFLEFHRDGLLKFLRGCVLFSEACGLWEITSLEAGANALRLAPVGPFQEVENLAMQRVGTRNWKVLAMAFGLVFLSTSASFAQCMGGPRMMGMGSTGTGMMGGPRMMGMGSTGTATAGQSMMSLQQAMQMAQVAQQMRAMQIERLRMMQAQRNRQAARQPRSGRTANRQLAANAPQENTQGFQANANSAPKAQATNGTAPTSRNRRANANRAN